jgi:hypothetical protein
MSLENVDEEDGMDTRLRKIVLNVRDRYCTQVLRNQSSVLDRCGSRCSERAAALGI